LCTHIYICTLFLSVQKRVEESIQDVKAGLAEWQHKAEQCESKLAPILNTVQQLQADYSKFAELEDVKQRVTRLTVAVPWAEAESAEQAAVAAAAQAAAADSKVRAVESGLLRCEAEAAAHAEARAVREAERVERQRTVQTATTAAAALQQELAVAREPLAALTAAKRSHELQLEEYTAKLQRLQK
jgi:chromosome segregation ATPase